MKIFVSSLVFCAFFLAFQACSGQDSGSATDPAGTETSGTTETTETGSGSKKSNANLSSKTFEELKELVLKEAKKCDQESIYKNSIKKVSQNSKLNKAQKKNSLINMIEDLDNSNC